MVRVHSACKLLKEVKITCDIHGLSDLNEYVNDDSDIAMMLKSIPIKCD